MTQPASPEELAIQAGVAALLGGAVQIAGWKRVFGGNARHAYAFDATWPDGHSVPCMMLRQIAAKHVDSDTAAEYAVLRAMNGANVRAPAAIALDADGSVTGAPSIVLQRIEGEAGAVPFLKQPDFAVGRALTEDLARATADLHRYDWKAGGLDAGETDPVLAQIAYWDSNFRKSRLEPHPVLAWLFAWLRRHAPQPERLALVHGDLRPGNFLYQGDQVTALLDWEMAHVGDPAEDVAWIYRALWSPERFAPIEQFLDAHAQQAGFAIPRRSVTFYRIFSEAKFASISLAASHSFASGGTSNLRHIDRAAKVPGCLRLALAWIASEDWGARDAAA